jgi:hypothetical protein
MKLALHVGINELDPAVYDGFRGWLSSCENDATALAGVTAQNGYVSVGLLTKRATRGDFLAALAEMSRQLRAGDRAFVSFSGHGSQWTWGASESTETFCFHDGELTERALRAALARFDSGVKLVLFLDCCHAGGASRGLREVRALPKGLRRDRPLDGPEPRAAIAARVAWLMACGPDESAYGDARFGEWTQVFLLATLDGGRAKLGESFWAARELVIEKLGGLQTPKLDWSGVPFPDEETW